MIGRKYEIAKSACIKEYSEAAVWEVLNQVEWGTGIEEAKWLAVNYSLFLTGTCDEKKYFSGIADY